MCGGDLKVPPCKGTLTSYLPEVLPSPFKGPLLLGIASSRGGPWNSSASTRPDTTTSGEYQREVNRPGVHERDSAESSLYLGDLARPGPPGPRLRSADREVHQTPAGVHEGFTVGPLGANGSLSAVCRPAPAEPNAAERTTCRPRRGGSYDGNLNVPL